MTPLLADVLISLLPTFVLSRLLLWLMMRWSGSVVRLVIVHAVSLMLCIAVVSRLTVTCLPIGPVAALAMFLPGQMAWLLVDAFPLVRRKRGRGD